MFRPTLTEADVARSTILSGFGVKKEKKNPGWLLLLAQYCPRAVLEEVSTTPK